MRVGATSRRCLFALGVVGMIAADTCMNLAAAHFSSAELAAISAAPAPGAGLPLDLAFRDDAGEATTIGRAIAGAPAVVIFADYTCRTLCGPILEFTAAGLARTGLTPGTDYRLVVIGINPRDGFENAHATRVAHLDYGNGINRGATFLSGDARNIQAAATALGLHYAFDPEHDQYAHPAAAYIVDPAGKVRRLLSPLGLSGSDLRLAIVDAGAGAIGNLADQIHLLCYGFDPVKGIYTERITTLLGYLAGGTLFLVAVGILTMVAHERRKAAS